MNRIRIPSALLCALCALCGEAFAQDLVPKAPPQDKAVVITNATVHTVSGKTITNGWVAFDKGLITAVGEGTPPVVNATPRVIHGAGKHIYPGLIAPYSHIGLMEIGAVRATLDTGETGAGTPEVRACVAVNPDSTLIPVARSNGVLVAGVFPQTAFSGQMAYFSGPGGLFPGRASAMRLDGWTWEDMTIEPDIGLVVNWPFPRPIEAPWMSRQRDEQQKEIDEALRAIDGFFSQARAYADARTAGTPMPTDIRFDAMRGLFGLNGSEGEGKKIKPKPVFIEANDYDAIEQAVTMCAKHKLRCVIIGGMDAPQCADLLKRHEVPVIVTGVYRFPKRDDSPYNDAYTLPARLEAAGVEWCMASGEEASNERNLPYSTALAVAHGLDHDAALRGITLSAAKVLGVDRTLGSIDPGKAATLLVADGDILEVTTHVDHAFIDGREIDLSDKQKSLDTKYRAKYKQADDAKH